MEQRLAVPIVAVLAAVAALGVLGCTGTELVPSDDAGSDCPAWFPAADTPCPRPGAACVFDCRHFCMCYSEGTWACEQQGPGCEPCPLIGVHPGAACDVPGATGCREWSICGAAACACTAGTWSCSDTPCPPQTSTPCPAEPPTTGAACSEPSSCVYPWAWTCSGLLCDCNGSTWSCSYGGTCGDGGVAG
jgi:hypothetical protein